MAHALIQKPDAEISEVLMRAFYYPSTGRGDCAAGLADVLLIGFSVGVRGQRYELNNS